MAEPAAAYDVTKEAIQFYEDHPIEFCTDLIGVELDTWQKRAFEALRDDHFVAIRAGSGVGKTVWLSLATMWFISTRPFSKVPTTAPSQHQLSDLLWGEHHKWISRSEYLQRLLVWTQTKVAVKGFGPQWYAVARTARTSPDGKVAEGLQGFHAEENLLYIVDEASGVDDAIFPAIEGALTGKGAYAILAANPTRLSGYFYDVFHHADMAGLYKLFHVSCLDSPFVEDRYLKMMKARYGENHPIYQIKVLGEFPSADVMMLFPVSDIEMFRNNKISDGDFDLRKIGFDREIGLDVGRTSAKSTMCVRAGNRVIEFASMKMKGTTQDTVDVTNWAIGYIQLYEPAAFKVDAIGVGAGVYDSLVRLYPRIVRPVVGNASCDPFKKERYANLRAQGYWELRSLLPDIYCRSIPDELIVQLGGIQYKTSTGKILIEDKESVIQRIGRSPDEMDAMMYAFIDSAACTSKMAPVFAAKLGNANNDLMKRSIFSSMNTNRPKSRILSKYGALNGQNS